MSVPSDIRRAHALSESGRAKGTIASSWDRCSRLTLASAAAATPADPSAEVVERCGHLFGHPDTVALCSGRLDQHVGFDELSDRAVHRLELRMRDCCLGAQVDPVGG